PRARDRPALHSFPTRRSSDLLLGCAAAHHEPAVRGMPVDDPAASLSALWVGHATVLLRLGRRNVLTDPNLSGSIVIQSRVTPPSDRKSTRLNSSHLVISYAVF